MALPRPPREQHCLHPPQRGLCQLPPFQAFLWAAHCVTPPPLPQLTLYTAWRFLPSSRALQALSRQPGTATSPAWPPGAHSGLRGSGGQPLPDPGNDRSPPHQGARSLERGNGEHRGSPAGVLTEGAGTEQTGGEAEILSKRQTGTRAHALFSTCAGRCGYTDPRQGSTNSSTVWVMVPFTTNSTLWLRHESNEV